MENDFILTRLADRKQQDLEAEVQMIRAVRQLPRAYRSGRPAVWRLLVSLPLKDFVSVRVRGKSVSPGEREIATTG